jgi:hypothetical protein
MAESIEYSMFATSEPKPCEYCGLVLYAKLVGASCGRKVRDGFKAEDSAWGRGRGAFPAAASFSLLFFRAAAYWLELEDCALDARN